LYCFDTDVLAAALLREPPMQLVRRLARTPGDEQCTTAVSVAEITYAAVRSGDGAVAGRVRELIASASTVFPFDAEAAETYGSLRAHLERLGVRLDESSLRIAAIALTHDLTLVTASARLYDRVPGLRIENWLEPDGLEASADDESGEGLSVLRLLDGDPGDVRNGDVRLDASDEGERRPPEVVSQLEGRARLAAERVLGPTADGAGSDEDDDASDQ
jgi:tRNA(fMet)-specific endonuclease VapC